PILTRSLNQALWALAHSGGFELDLCRDRDTPSFGCVPINRMQTIILTLAWQSVVPIERPLQGVQDGGLAGLVFSADDGQLLACIRREIELEMPQQAEVFKFGANEFHRPSSLPPLPGAPRRSERNRPAALHLSLIRCWTLVPCTRCWR